MSLKRGLRDNVLGYYKVRSFPRYIYVWGGLLSNCGMLLDPCIPHKCRLFGHTMLHERMCVDAQEKEEVKAEEK